jgi:hypothetical protein
MALSDKLYKVWVEVEASGVNEDGIEDYEQHICEPLDACQEIEDFNDAVFLQIQLQEMGELMQDHVTYLRSSGGYCPSCGSNIIEGSFVDIENGHAYQKISCNNCDAVWDDIYKLAGRHIREGA